MLSCGPVFNKYTGHGGKSGSNDAKPEYVAALRKIMKKNNVRFQTAEMGRVDVGGGGTIAYLCRIRNGSNRQRHCCFVDACAMGNNQQSRYL